jgi:tRNA (adenine37-N6)-methyltransferase
MVEENRKNGGTSSLAILAAASVLVIVGGGYQWWYRRRKLPDRRQDDEIRRLCFRLQQQRKEERTGRIRAEVRLRTALKQVQQLQIKLHSQEGRNGNDGTKPHTNIGDETNGSLISGRAETMLIQCIGTVTSPFTKRMGTPRQGALVPASRGFVQFHSQFPGDMASGLELYSHVWLIFEFHANTDLGGSAAHVSSKNKKTKVRPPRAGGMKVGQLATRSPHRPNPLGLSLVTVDRWDPLQRRLHISGLDLVNGTPVYDIKPLVPWDIPGYSISNRQLERMDCSSLRVPDWVSCTEDIIENVSFTKISERQLHGCVSAGLFSPLYLDDSEGAHEMILQILAQDPRSSHKGLKRNARGTKATVRPQLQTENDLDIAVEASYSIILCQSKVSFSVAPSGCEVISVVPIEFEGSQYVDGVPLISKGISCGVD